MPTRTITFSTYSDTGGATAWGPGNSTPAFPSGYTLLADPCRITAGQLTKFSGAGNSILLDDTPLTSDIIEAEVNLGAVTSDSEGPVICSPAGIGWMLLSNSTNARLFNLTSGGVIGTQVTGNVAALASNSLCRLRYTQSLDKMELFDDNVLIMTWNSVSSANTDWRAGAGIRNAGSLVSLSSIYAASQTLDTLTSPLVMGGAFSGTSTGFSNGAATLGFSGVSVPVTISSGAFSGTLPNFVDNGLIPFLPATAQTITLTQSSNSATINRNISLATGWEVIRNAGNPDTFESLVVGDLTYLAQHFIDAGNPLTTNDTAYWDTSLGLSISQDGKPTAPDALTQDIFIWRASDSKTYIHNVIITEEGEVIVSAAPSNVTFKTGRLEAKESIATFRAKLPFQAQSVAVDITALRTDFNSLLTKMTNAGWFVGGEEQFTMIKIALQCGLPQLVKRIKEQAPDQMPVQSASVAADVAALRTDLNSLLTKLKNANLMATS